MREIKEVRERRTKRRNRREKQVVKKDSMVRKKQLGMKNVQDWKIYFHCNEDQGSN